MHSTNVLIYFIVAITVADFCLATSLVASRENFQKALDFCLQMPSYVKLKASVKNESSITNANVVLDILKENQDNYKSRVSLPIFTILDQFIKLVLLFCRTIFDLIELANSVIIELHLITPF